MNNKLGVHYGFWSEMWSVDIIPYLKRASSVGFDVLEVSTGMFLDLPDSKIKDIKKVADDHNIELTHCLGQSVDSDMASEDKAVRQRGVETAKRILEVIGLMDGKILSGLIHTAWLALPKEGIYSKQDYIERSVETFKPVLKNIEDMGIIYCIEVVNRFEHYMSNTAQETVELIKLFESRNVGILLDTFHMNIEEDSFEDAIKTAGNLLWHLHIGETNRKVPGQGRLPWGEIAQSLNDIGYSGRIVMEPFLKMGADRGRDIKIWRDLSNNASEADMDVYAKQGLEFMGKTFNS